VASQRERPWRRPPAGRRRGARARSSTSQRREGDVAVTVATAAVDNAAAMAPARRRVRARVVRAVVHRPTPSRRQARRQLCQRRWPQPPPTARVCCGNIRDHEIRRALSVDTTPCLKTQNGRLPQGPQSPILTIYSGIATSWPFVAASTCLHGPVNVAPALKYPLNHYYASADRTDDDDVATSSNFTERCGQPRRMFPSSRTRWGTSIHGVGSKRTAKNVF